MTRTTNLPLKQIHPVWGLGLLPGSPRKQHKKKILHEYYVSFSDATCCCSYYQSNGALESQKTSSQDWLEELCRDCAALPLFLPDSEDDVPAPRARDHVADPGSDSDKENELPLCVHLLSWSQHRQLAGILTRVAFGHNTISSAILELRDAVLDKKLWDQGEDQELWDQDEDQELQEERRDPPVAPDAADSEKGFTSSETKDEEDDSVSHSGIGGGSLAVGGFAGLVSRLQSAFRNQQLAGTMTSQDCTAPGDVLNSTITVKRKASAIEPSPQDAPEPRQTRCRVVPVPTESQVERDERRCEEYKETNCQRLTEGLSPRKPQCRHVPKPPRSLVQTPSMQLIEELLGYNFHGSQAQALQSGFLSRG